MLWFQALVLGVVQGLTEFLPVSSSGHLVLFQALFGMKEPMLTFDVALHAGTLIAVLIYFWKEIVETLSGFWRFASKCLGPCAPYKKRDSPLLREKGTVPFLWFYILLTLVPTGMIAVIFKDRIEGAFSNLPAVACAWLAMGLLLIFSAKFERGARPLSEVGWRRAFWIGLAQGIALMPGISRSGSTILAGMFAGLKKEDAARFSFLISIPAVLAAIAMHLNDGIDLSGGQGPAMAVGFVASAITGYAVIKWLMGVIQKGRFYMFGYYGLAVGVFSLILAKFYL